MTGFHEVQFPPDISDEASGGPGYSTTVVTTVSGHELRNANWAAARGNWAAARGNWNVAHGLKRRDQAAALIAFFRARKGRAYGFRFKDWTDYQAFAQALGLGDGANKIFQLVRRYASGGEIETRIIAKPVTTGTVKIYRDGVEAVTGWTLNTATGLVTFTTAPGSGVQVMADFDFDVPVRFDSDQMDITIESYQLGSWGQIQVAEIRP
ncbi:MAG: TIGR02217 family protein [Rhodospirillales bacterium]|nr:MAG: TIGR02217 family protein [Rhodospirillales bacterium]